MCKRADVAKDLFKEGYNCAQSVFLSFPEVYENLGLGQAAAARLTNCLGGGLSQTGGICGAVSAACLIVSGREGRDSPSRQGEALAQQQRTYRLVQELQDAIRQEFGDVNCPALLERGRADSGDAQDEKFNCALYVERCTALADAAIAEGING